MNAHVYSDAIGQDLYVLKTTSGESFFVQLCPLSTEGDECSVRILSFENVSKEARLPQNIVTAIEQLKNSDEKEVWMDVSLSECRKSFL